MAFRTFQIAIFLSLSLKCFAQDIQLGINERSFRKTLEQSIISLFGTDKKIRIRKEESLPVNIGNIIIQDPDKKGGDDFLLVYGRHLLNIDFDKPFELGLNLKGLDASVELGDVSIKLGKSKKSGNKVSIPVFGNLTIENIDGGFSEVDLFRATLTDKNLERQNTLINNFLKIQKSDLTIETKRKKVESLLKSRGDNIESIAKELNEALNLQNCIKKVFGIEKKSFVNIVSKNHRVKSENLKIKFQGVVHILLQGEKAKLTLRNFTFNDNITAESFKDHFRIEFDRNSFQVLDTLAVTSNQSGTVNYCDRLKKSGANLSKHVIGKKLIDKVLEVLNRKVPELLNDKAFPKVAEVLSKVELNFPYFYYFTPNEKIKDSIKKKVKNKELADLLISPFESLSLGATVVNFETENNYLNIELESQVEVDKKDIKCVDGSYLCDYFDYKPVWTGYNSDLRVSISAAPILSLITNQYEDLLLNYLSLKIPTVKNGLSLFGVKSGKKLLDLSDENFMLVPTGKNKIDAVIRVKLNPDALRIPLKSFLLKNKLKKRDWLSLFKKKSKKDLVEFAIELELELLKENGKNSLKISLPSARNFFSSKYFDTNWKQYPLFLFVQRNLNPTYFYYPTSLFGFSLGFKRGKRIYHGLYQEIFNALKKKNIEFTYEAKKGSKPYILVPIDLNKKDSKSPMIFQDLSTDENGNINFHLNLKEKVFKAPFKNLKSLKEINL